MAHLYGGGRLIAQPFMVIIGTILDSLMTCCAVVAQRTLGISVKKLCHVPNMKEVGACVKRNVLKDQEHAFSVLSLR